MFNTEIDWCRISGSALIPSPLGFSLYPTLRFSPRRSAAFFVAVTSVTFFLYRPFVKSRVPVFFNLSRCFSTNLYKPINKFVCPFTTLFTRVLAPLPLPSPVTFVSVHELKFHTLVFLVTVARSLLHCNFFTVSFQSALPVPHLSRTSTWSYLTETNNSSVHEALTFYLLGNLWLLYLELYVHNNPDILTAQPIASPPRLCALPSTSATVATSSSSTVTSSTSNVAAASRS